MICWVTCGAIYFGSIDFWVVFVVIFLYILIDIVIMVDMFE